MIRAISRQPPADLPDSPTRAIVLLPLHKRYTIKGNTFMLHGCLICARCGHWEASYLRMHGLATRPSFPCQCCEVRKEYWDSNRGRVVLWK